MGHSSPLVQDHQEIVMATIPKTVKLEFPRFRDENCKVVIYNC